MILVKPSHEIIFMHKNNLFGSNPLHLIERAGRTCYKSESEDGITDATSQKFVKMLIEKGHHSVIEHSNITVKFICDRGVTHELVRHRLASYSQESTRYCNYKGGVTFVIPPWMNVTEQNIDHACQITKPLYESLTGPERTWLESMYIAENHYKSLLGDGWSPQQARSVLPNSLKTEIVMTCNIREWRHVLTLRTSKAAHPQMRELMIPLLDELKKGIPILFDDIGVKEKPALLKDLNRGG